MLLKDEQIISKEVLYCIEYIYCYWHNNTGERSSKVYKQAPVKTMARNYLLLHTMDFAMAI